MTDRDVVVRLVKATGMLVGLMAGFFVFALFTAGNANADQADERRTAPDATRPGLIGTVTDGATDVVHGVSEAAEPLVEPVARAAAPVTRPVLAPVTQALSPVLFEVTDVVAPITDPVLGPVVHAARPVVTPLARATASQQVVDAVSGTGRSPDPPGSERIEREVRADGAVRGPVPVQLSTVPAQGLTVPGQVSRVPTVDPAKAGHVAQGEGVRVGAARQVAESGWLVWSGKSVPRAPSTPPSGPAATGAPGGTANAPHGPSVDGSTRVGASGLARPSASWCAASAAMIGPSWWTSYGRHHPS
nr:hypothetical protein [Kibdelosporangium sp. MJ126-NF4]